MYCSMNVLSGYLKIHTAQVENQTELCDSSHRKGNRADMPHQNVVCL